MTVRRRGGIEKFWQVGIEAFGVDSPAIDAEIIAAGNQFFSTLGIKDLTLHLNSIGDPACRPKYVEDLTAYAKAHLDELCGKCYARHETESDADLRLQRERLSGRCR